MQKSKIIGIILAISVFVSGTFAMRLANDGKSGVYARSLEQVLICEPQQVDIGTAALIISEKWDDLVGGRQYLERLDEMAQEIQKRTNGAINPRTVQVINEYLFDELGFDSVAEADNPDDLFLHTVMDRKNGYCLSLSVLYLSIGERLGLPLYGVVVPGHFFVRYDDGKVQFNIETTSKGHFADDDHYRKSFNVPEGDDRSIYLKNLNPHQTIGCFLNNLGNVYIQTEQIETAQNVLEQAVNINPYLAESRTNLGNIYLRKCRVEDALNQYRFALNINRKSAKTHNNLGNAYNAKGWSSYAIQSYETAINLDPNLTDAYKNLAAIYIAKDNLEMAYIKINQALNLWPQDIELNRRLGDVYLQMGNYNQAFTKYKYALSLGPDDPSVWYSMSQCYGKMGSADAQMDALQKTLRLKPDMVPAILSLGNVYFNKKMYDLAIKQYQKAANLKPGDATIYYNIGAAYSNDKQYDKAVTEYLRAVKIDPKMGEAHLNLAVGFYNLKKYELANQHLKTAKELGVEIDEEIARAIERAF